ncbi:unnamed protein product, partial [Cylicostephanus goldi]
RSSFSISPENAVEIESTYKPSAGTIGRALIKAIDFFKERILRASNRVRDPNMWKYDWQRAIMGQDWRPLTKMHEKGFRTEKIVDKRGKLKNFGWASLALLSSCIDACTLVSTQSNFRTIRKSLDMLKSLLGYIRL